MPFIPHTPDQVAAMLAVIGVEDIDDLFDEIPADLRAGELKGIPAALPEMEVGRLMAARARADGQPLCFIGAGAYDHHIPAVVWQLVARGELYSAYTPYQAEASQGTLQILYEFQSHDDGPDRPGRLQRLPVRRGLGPGGGHPHGGARQSARQGPTGPGSARPASRAIGPWRAPSSASRISNWWRCPSPPPAVT